MMKLDWWNWFDFLVMSYEIVNRLFDRLPSALSIVAGTPICDVTVVVISFKFFESQLFDTLLLLLLTNAFCVFICRFVWWRLEYCGGGGDFKKVPAFAPLLSPLLMPLLVLLVPLPLLSSTTLPPRAIDVLAILLLLPLVFTHTLLLLISRTCCESGRAGESRNLLCLPGNARNFSSLSMHVLSVLSGNWDIWDIGTAGPIFEFFSVEHPIGQPKHNTTRFRCDIYQHRHIFVESSLVFFFQIYFFIFFFVCSFFKWNSESTIERVSEWEKERKRNK